MRIKAMRHLNSMTIVAALLTTLLLGASDARANDALATACGEPDLMAANECNLRKGSSCVDACNAQDAETYCLAWCGLSDCHDYECYEWQCMSACEPEFWYGCSNDCADGGGALFCDDVYLPFVQDRTTCVDALCSQGMLDRVACSG